MFSGSTRQIRSLLGDNSVSIKDRASVAEGLKTFKKSLVDSTQCKKAGISVTSQNRIANILLGSTVAITVLALVTGNFFFLLLVAVPPLVARLYISSKMAKRVSAFDKDFAALLLSLASSLKAGVDATSALERSVELFPNESVMHEELAAFVRELASGTREDEAIGAFASSVDHPDIELFRRSFLLSRKQGASLSMCLQRLARFTRQRQSFRRKIAASLAMQKLSAIGIGGCAAMIVVIQLVSQTESFFAALEHPLGFRMLVLGGLFILTGLGLMLRLATNGAGARA